jgi:hypothetical protein
MFIYVKKNMLPTLLFGIIISILEPGCATTEKSADDEPPITSHYTIEIGEVEKHSAPLPNYYPFYMNLYLGSELERRYLKYRGWDFSGNGIVDYLEELNEDGETIGHYFDFEQNGVINAELGSR